MSKSKYNVLMMRDNTPVKRYRLSPVWLKLGLYFLIFLLAMAGGGGYLGFTYWKKNSTLTEELRTVERELREVNIELERHENIDKILKSNDPEELQALFGTSAEPHTDSKPITPPAQPVDLRKVFDRIDSQQVRVDNLQAKVTGRKLRVTFNLNNLQTEDTLTGRATLILVTPSGKEKKVALNRSDLAFQIQRFKQISTTFTLPGTMEAKDIFGMKLLITKPTGQTIFRETYPLSYIRS